MYILRIKQCCRCDNLVYCARVVGLVLPRVKIDVQSILLKQITIIIRIYHIFPSVKIKWAMYIITKPQKSNDEDTICTSPKHAKM
jgi:hypothetical protein